MLFGGDVQADIGERLGKTFFEVDEIDAPFILGRRIVLSAGRNPFISSLHHAEPDRFAGRRITYSKKYSSQSMHGRVDREKNEEMNPRSTIKMIL